MAKISIEQTPEQARAFLDSRVEPVTALVEARQRVADLREQLAQAERDDKRAYVLATKDRWSADGLKKFGLENTAGGRRGSSARNDSAPRHAEQLAVTRADA
ncbi:hypothetical protein NNX28_02365 [Arthrobacter sp. zg-Y859]|uniref:Uncharacterized protein n=1 Tax=Arthrobacter jinronghuae TaxID=2964609 RepID=A0ABT1NM28_9MICC|nr:hypothetical protein [Arthrobacter jinronghuae]MCQ1948772.1 hypothetical protein [Arthrobacter jinronghuae]UWX78416.1 hypothetical protein N2K98_15900 [Arthrobacter jinronghuae]